MPPVARPRKREWAVLRKCGPYRVRRYGTRWEVDECQHSNAPTAGAALWTAEFLEVVRN